MLQRKSSVAAWGSQVNAVGGRLVAVMVLLCGLAACGQKGPLTLTQPVPGAGVAASAPTR